MTALELIQEVCDRVGVSRPTGLANSNDAGARQFASLLNKEGQSVVSEYRWHETLKDFEITLQDGVASYQLPDDFLFISNNTIYDDNNNQPIFGGTSTFMWTALTKGVVTSNPYRHFRITGAKDGKFHLFDTPSASDAGSIVSFQYYSKNWLRPMTWVSSASFATNSYCFYDGNYYKATSGGVAGATAPTHTTGSASDGGVTWAFGNYSYNKILANTDVPILPFEVLALGVEWRWRRAQGFDFVDQLMEYRNMAQTFCGFLKAPKTLSLSRRRLLGRVNLPEGDFGL